METQELIKETVKQKYSEIALQSKEANQASCCGSGCCSTDVYNIMTDDYKDVEGYNADADLGLGCGLPVQYAHIKKGDVVIDLGSGAGNDCFVARAETGETGKVIGIDFTPAMISKARSNAEKLGYNNIEFRFSVRRNDNKTQQQPLPGSQHFLSSFAGFSAYTVMLLMRVLLFLYSVISAAVK